MIRSYSPSRLRGLTILNIGQNHRITGGSDRYFFDLAQMLEAEDNTVVPFAAQHPENLHSKWEAYFPRGADFQSISPLNLARFLHSPEAAQRLATLISRVGPQLAHLHIYYGKLTSSILKVLKSNSIPAVQTLHEYKLICPVYTLNSNGENCQKCSVGHYAPSILGRCNQGSLARSMLSAVEASISVRAGAVTIPDRFIAVSEFVRQRAIEGGIPSSKISVLHNFTFPDRLRPTVNEGSYFVYYGRIERLKGIFTLLRAAEAAGVKLVIVGVGKASEEVAEYVAAGGLGERVSLFPFLSGEALGDIVRGAICTVVPSEWYETFGLTVIESFCYGRPVIASKIGGMTEIIDEGSDGFLFAPGDERDLADKLRFLDKNRSVAVRMGVRARAKAERRFSPEKHFEGLSRIYNEIL